MFNKNKETDLSDMSHLTSQDIRSMERGRHASHRRLPSKGSVAAAIAASVAVLGAGMTNEADVLNASARADAEAQEQIVAQNPEIFQTDGNMAITVEETVPYVVQPGDTAWEIGTHVERNVDRIPGNQDVRPFVDDIVRQAEEDGLQIGEVINLPPNSDVHENPGTQLTTK